MHRGSRWDEDGLYSKTGAEQTDRHSRQAFEQCINLI